MTIRTLMRAAIAYLEASRRDVDELVARRVVPPDTAKPVW